MRRRPRPTITTYSAIQWPAEDEYNKWYNEQHALDVVAVPGFVTAQRFVMNDPQLHQASAPLPKYVVVYKIVTDNLETVFKEVSRRRATNETVMSPTFDGATSVGYTYRNIGPEVKGTGGAPAGAKSGTKQTYLQMVFSETGQGKLDDGLSDLAGSAGVVSAQRMILERPATKGLQGTKYLDVFTIETSDMNTVLKTPRSAHSSPAVDASSLREYTFRAIGPVVSGDQVRADRSKSARAGK